MIHWYLECLHLTYSASFFEEDEEESEKEKQKDSQEKNAGTKENADDGQ